MLETVTCVPSSFRDVGRERKGDLHAIVKPTLHSTKYGLQYQDNHALLPAMLSAPPCQMLAVCLAKY